ncbi:alpha/beta hydrolase family protein [Paenisporosarcina sp. TG-14]|uniref:alpha/beta hydrolase family protein n=1 Tax=Paenisporosarcina sp. TG-14 TaxID=1231057 RepID=UPI00031EA678|nr:prolyl oligopeptidase family serine peptidase [Paenisporosarcina sp. TG-14]
MKEDATIEQKRPYPSPNPQVKLTEIIYWSCGLRVKGLLAEPVKLGTYEGILYLRGGIQSIGMVRPARIAQFAAQGFIVFAPYYRGNRGGEGRDEFAGEDRYDAVNGVDVLKQFLSVDRIHLFAFSRGGIMALWTAILRNDVTSVVTWSGVSDVILTYEERNDMRRMMKRVIGGNPNNARLAYEYRQPIPRINDITCSLLIIHGEKDLNVGIEHAFRLEKALEKEEKVYETMYFKELTHFFEAKINAQIVHNLTTWMKQQRG